MAPNAGPCFVLTFQDKIVLFIKYYNTMFIHRATQVQRKVVVPFLSIKNCLYFLREEIFTHIYFILTYKNNCHFEFIHNNLMCRLIWTHTLTRGTSAYGFSLPCRSMYLSLYYNHHHLHYFHNGHDLIGAVKGCALLRNHTPSKWQFSKCFYVISQTSCINL